MKDDVTTADLPLPEMSQTEAVTFAGGPQGVLLIHGFTGSPWEMRSLGAWLHREGRTAHVVRLAGHGTTPEDMEATTAEDWYGSARAGLDALEQHTRDNVVVGQSMGALLALRLAAEEPARVRKVVLLAPALVTAMSWLPWVAPLIPLSVAASAGRLRFVPKGESDVADDEARASSPSYRATPLRSVAELVRLQQAVRPMLARLHQPVLVIHARQDHTCPLENVGILQRELPGPVRTLILPESFHVISVDKERHLVAQAVGAFLQNGG